MKKIETPTIENNGIAVRNPSAIQMQSVQAQFKRLFRCQPVITIRGIFPAASVNPTAKADLRRDWNLLDQDRAVILVGRLFVTLDLGTPWGAVQLIPTMGERVEVRFRLPQ